VQARRADLFVVALSCLSLSVLHACESEDAAPGDDDGELPTKEDTNARDGAVDGAVLVPLDSGPGLGDAVAQSDACPNNEIVCGSGCVNTLTNAMHCGGCNKPCDSGMCSGGSCSQ
jgi:hypothetical protein